LSALEIAVDFGVWSFSAAWLLAFATLWPVDDLLSVFDEPPNNDAASFCFSSEISTCGLLESYEVSCVFEFPVLTPSTCVIPFTAFSEEEFEVEAEEEE
jgi:hypothetical protein